YLSWFLKPAGGTVSGLCFSRNANPLCLHRLPPGTEAARAKAEFLRGRTTLVNSQSPGSAWGSKVTESSIAVSELAEENFHCVTDFCALSAKMGLPPSTSVSRTVPSGLTKTFRRTTPPMPLDFRIEGYVTETFLTILRSLFWAIPAAPKNRNTVKRRAPRALFKQREPQLLEQQQNMGSPPNFEWCVTMVGDLKYKRPTGPH